MEVPGPLGGPRHAVGGEGVGGDVRKDGEVAVGPPPSGGPLTVKTDVEVTEGAQGGVSIGVAQRQV